MNGIILKVNDLVTCFETEEGQFNAVDGISFQLKKGKTLGLVGESGCGKSVTALSIMRLLPKPMGKIVKGQVLFENTDLLQLRPKEMYKIRGLRIAMIFQEPMTALNPVQKIGQQIQEMFNLHFPALPLTEKKERTYELLKKVGIPDPETKINEYPHQLSGGMRQRVMIAMALSCNPDLLIADEPTTALDVTIQAQILELIKDLQQETGMSLIYITHDLGVVAELCDEIVVMYAGKIAEIAGSKELFSHPQHPYTQGLLDSIPRMDTPCKTPLKTIKGRVPVLSEIPTGCRFQNRCPYTMTICTREIPPAFLVNEKHAAPEHLAHCFLLKKEKGSDEP